MDLTNLMSPKERLEMKGKRIAFIQKTIEGYASLHEYAHDKDEWFAIRGMKLPLKEECISLGK